MFILRKMTLLMYFATAIIVLMAGCGTSNPDIAVNAKASGNTAEAESSSIQNAAPESYNDLSDLLVKDTNYRIGPGDRMFISLWEHPELGTPAVLADKGGTPVEENGVIFLPVVGEIKVAGLTLGEAREVLTRAYAKYVKNPQVIVSIQNYGSKYFYILGEVKNSGTYEIKHPVSLLQAISIAGGITQVADLKKAYVIRDNNKILQVDFEKLLNNGATGMNIEITTNDFIFIPKKDEKIVYVLGEVKTPGAVKMANDRINLISAIASSGDFTIFAVKDNIKILRGGVSNPEVITANLSNLRNVEENLEIKNVELEPGDIVYVPDTAIGRLDKILDKIAPVLRTINEGLQPFYIYKLFQNIK